MDKADPSWAVFGVIVLLSGVGAMAYGADTDGLWRAIIFFSGLWNILIGAATGTMGLVATWRTMIDKAVRKRELAIPFAEAVEG